MDGRNRGTNPGGMGVHSTDWMDEEDGGPRELFYPWAYLSEPVNGTYYMQYMRPAEVHPGEPVVKGTWPRGGEPRHAGPSSV